MKADRLRPSRHGLAAASALVVGLVLVSACSTRVSDDAAAPNEATTTTTSGAPSPPDSGLTTALSLPPRVASALALSDLDPTELVCVSSALGRSFTDDRTLADDDTRLAVAVGSALGSCVPTPKLAAVVIERLRTPSASASLTSEQLDCVRATVVNAEPSRASSFVGAVAIGAPGAVADSASTVDQACGTSFGAQR